MAPAPQTRPNTHPLAPSSMAGPSPTQSSTLDSTELPPPPPKELAFVQDPAQARSLLDPLRRSILEHLAEPGSASGVARVLELPRQRVNYHVRELEREGLLLHMGDRRRGNCVERLVRASARRYLVDPQVTGTTSSLGSAASTEPGDPFSTEELLLAATRSLREVGELREDAKQVGKRVPTLTLEARIRFGSRGDEVEFAHAMHEAFARLTQHYDRPDVAEARPFRITLAGHPIPGHPIPDHPIPENTK